MMDAKCAACGQPVDSAKEVPYLGIDGTTIYICEQCSIDADGDPVYICHYADDGGEAKQEARDDA